MTELRPMVKAVILCSLLASIAARPRYSFSSHSRTPNHNSGRPVEEVSAVEVAKQDPRTSHQFRSDNTESDLPKLLDNGMIEVVHGTSPFPNMTEYHLQRPMEPINRTAEQQKQDMATIEKLLAEIDRLEAEKASLVPQDGRPPRSWPAGFQA